MPVKTPAPYPDGLGSITGASAMPVGSSPALALCTLHFARSSQRLRSYKDMGDKWDLIKVHLYRIGYSGVVKSAILANQRHHAKCLLKENVHD